MQTKTLLTAASLAASLLAVPAAMANHIDFFAEGGAPLVLVPGAPGNSASQTYNDTDDGTDNGTILGDTRFTQLVFTPGQPLGTNITAQIDVLGGQLSYSNDGNTMGTLTLRYGDTATLDLVSNANGPDYQFLRVDVAALGQSAGGDDTFNVSVTATDTDSSDVQTFTINAVGDYFLPYAAFAGVDFTAVSSLNFDFASGNTGADLTLDEITREIVPEPTTAGLIGVAAMGLLARRRRA